MSLVSAVANSCKLARPSYTKENKVSEDIASDSVNEVYSGINSSHQFFFVKYHGINLPAHEIQIGSLHRGVYMQTGALKPPMARLA